MSARAHPLSSHVASSTPICAHGWCLNLVDLHGMHRVMGDAPASTSGRGEQERDDTPHTGVADLSQEQLQRNQELIDQLRDKLVRLHTAPARTPVHANQWSTTTVQGCSTGCASRLHRERSVVFARKERPCGLRDCHAQILAPLTKGGNLPFRRLCADFGAEVTMSEMSFARHLIRGTPHEKARLKRAANEHCYGACACRSLS